MVGRHGDSTILYVKSEGTEIGVPERLSTIKFESEEIARKILPPHATIRFIDTTPIVEYDTDPAE